MLLKVAEKSLSGTDETKVDLPRSHHSKQKWLMSDSISTGSLQEMGTFPVRTTYFRLKT